MCMNLMNAKLIFSAACFDESNSSNSHSEAEEKPEKAHILTPPLRAY